MKLPGILPASVSLLLLSFLSLCSCSVLKAQIFPEDIRLSHDVLQTVLPEDAKIQSADRIGDLTLVVWGSSRKVNDDSVANILYWQMLSGTDRLGESQPLTDDRFDPFGFVQVLVLDDRFLVVWNDRREGEKRSWYVTIDRTGTMGTAKPLWIGHPLTSRGIMKIVRESGWLIVWNDTITNHIIAREFDLMGTASNEPYELDTGYVGNLQPDLPSPGNILIDRGNLPPLIIEPDGAISRVEKTAAEKFTGIFSIEPDGSVLIIRNNVAMEYASILDTQAIREIRFQIPVPHYPYYNVPGSEYIARSSAGKMRIYFLWYLTDYTCSGPRVGVKTYMMEEDGSFGFTDPVNVVSTTIAYGFPRESFMPLKASAISQNLGCETRLTSMTAQIRYSISIQGQGTTDTFTVSVNMLERNETIQWYGGHNHPPLPALATILSQSCPIAPGLPVVRSYSKRKSEIILDFSSDSITLAAPVPILLSSVPHHFPGIISSGGRFLVSSVVFGKDSAAVSSTWNGQNAGTALPYSGTSLNVPEKKSNLNTVITQYNLDGIPLIHHFYSQPLTGSEGKKYLQSFHSLLMLTDTGWKEIAEAHPVHTSRLYGLLSAARDPDDSTILIATAWLPTLSGNAYGDSISVSSYSPTGERRWNIDSLHIGSLGFRILPLRDKQFAATGFDKRIYQFNGDSLLEVGTPLSRMPYLNIPFFGNLQLAGYGVDNSFYLEKRNGSGELIKENSVVMPSGVTGYQALLNRSDSGIIIFYTRMITPTHKENGVYLLLFDKDLKLRQNQRVSAMPSTAVNPTGAIRNDTLFVVWEDDRSGNSEIYANAVLLITDSATTSVTAEQSQAQTLIASILPNPAHDRITVTSAQPGREGTYVELWNMLGERMLRQEMGTEANEATLNVQGLPEGTYVITVQANDNRESRLVTIVRE